jgi:hypothetical protein
MRVISFYQDVCTHRRKKRNSCRGQYVYYKVAKMCMSTQNRFTNGFSKHGFSALAWARTQELFREERGDCHTKKVSF